MEKTLPNRIPFTKLSATGNDFILFERRSAGLHGDEYAFFQRICARRTGIGADGILLLEEHPEAHYRMRYYNADGRPSEMCGNGARAAAFYAFYTGMAPREQHFVIGEDRLRAVVRGRQVALTLQTPKQRSAAPGALQHPEFEEIGFAVTGVPHYVLQTNHIDDVPVAELGRFYRHAEIFAPAGTNVNFVQRLGERRFKIRTYERGVEAETLACGTGVVSSAYLLRDRLGVPFPYVFETQGGQLTVDEEAQSGRPVLAGTVRMICRGEILTEFFEEP